jgi:hypothetical protein
MPRSLAGQQCCIDIPVVIIERRSTSLGPAPQFQWIQTFRNGVVYRDFSLSKPEMRKCGNAANSETPVGDFGDVVAPLPVPKIAQRRYRFGLASLVSRESPESLTSEISLVRISTNRLQNSHRRAGPVC